MSWLDILRGRKPEPTPADLARNRLNVVVSHRRSGEGRADFLPKLQAELVAVVARYVAIDPGKVVVNLEGDGDLSMLEIEIELPEPAAKATGAALT